MRLSVSCSLSHSFASTLPPLRIAINSNPASCAQLDDTTFSPGRGPWLTPAPKQKFPLAVRVQKQSRMTASNPAKVAPSRALQPPGLSSDSIAHSSYSSGHQRCSRSTLITSRRPTLPEFKLQALLRLPIYLSCATRKPRTSSPRS
ncbi:hypothetical protein PENSPDRAFT_156284 [Peniophora sp. CONT]|nr:hypothetical protein PENSPDRAFT_156284 [Peniophora sp. CONT]